MIKLITKAKNERHLLLSFWKSMEHSLKTVRNLIIHLSYLLKTWEENIEYIATTVMATQIREDLELETENFLKILETKINLVNATY